MADSEELTVSAAAFRAPSPAAAASAPTKSATVDLSACISLDDIQRQGVYVLA